MAKLLLVLSALLFRSGPVISDNNVRFASSLNTTPAYSFSYVQTPFDCYTFTVDNASSYNVGNVRINGSATYVDFSVTTTGQYQQTLCFGAVSATINGSTVTFPNRSDVQLANSYWVTVTWQSPSFVEIANRNEINSPNP